jgi:hypothetical protein
MEDADDRLSARCCHLPLDILAERARQIAQARRGRFGFGLLGRRRVTEKRERGERDGLHE